jgi:hypothetical protein
MIDSGSALEEKFYAAEANEVRLFLSGSGIGCEPAE